ncbi:hypothetical protein CPB83DRAFT_415322 [Crepidotus variabilis]|uniref:Uncharacterized protein n=1 Tax=Crepidotus variabilis TaxID=179855 RepID=A0A9P6EQ17_9AGAR|nr:hypothetical protein CPB83DRAFT_415322 [Crepidotus variabilis]
MTDLQARIGPKIFPHLTWIRPGYHPPKTSHKHGRQTDGGEQEALNIFGAAGHPRDSSIESENSEESAHDDLRMIRTRRGESSPDQLPYPTHVMGRSLSSSSSLLQRMGISKDTQRSLNPAVNLSSVAEKSLIERLDTPTSLDAETGGSDTPSRMDISKPSPRTHKLTPRHIENPQSVAYPDTASLPLDFPERTSGHDQNGASFGFTAPDPNNLAYSNNLWDRASSVPASFAALRKIPDCANQRVDDSENLEQSSLTNIHEAASSSNGDQDGLAEFRHPRDSLTPFSALEDGISDSVHQPSSLQHLTSQSLRLPSGSPSISSLNEQFTDNILLPLAQENAFERSKHTPPGTYDDPVSVNPDVITREEISSFNDRIPAITEELRTLRYTPSPDRHLWPESSPKKNSLRTPFASSSLRVEQGDTHDYTHIPSGEKESLNQADLERRLPRRSARERVARHAFDHTDRRAVRKQKRTHRSLSPSRVLHSSFDERYLEARRSWTSTHSDSPRRSRCRSSSSERHPIPLYHNRLSQSPSRGQASFNNSQQGRFSQRSPSSKEQFRNGYQPQNGSHHWRRLSNDYPSSEQPVKYPPLETQEAEFILALAKTVDVDLNMDVDFVPLAALQSHSEPRHSFLPCHNIPGLWFAQQGLNNIGISTVVFEIDATTAVARRIPPNGLRDETKGTFENESKLALLLCCFDRHGFETTMQTLGTSITSEDLVDALLKMQTIWPPEGHLIISVNAEDQEGSTYLPHDIMSSLFLRIEPNVHKGTNFINLIQLSDMSDFMFVLLAQEHLDTPRGKVDSDVDRAAVFAILEDSTL